MPDYKAIWEFLNKSLLPQAGQAGAKVADAIDQPSLDRSRLSAQIHGFLGGAAEGAGNLISELFTPINLAATALSGGAGMAGRAGKLGISNAARMGEAALNAPLVAEGAHNVMSGDTMSEKGAGLFQAAMGGIGAKSAMTHAFDPSAVAGAYAKQKGLPKPMPHVPVKADPKFGKQVADAYEALDHNPTDPDTKAAYEAFTKETADQFDFLTKKAGVKVEPNKGDPYKSSNDMRADVKKNNRLKVFQTNKDDFAPDHPMAEGDINDKFRAVHDYFAHAKGGHQFGPSGEENAFLEHSKLYGPEAQRALATETRGQNSTVNFGKYGEANRANPANTIFPDQKAGLLPPNLTKAEFANAIQRDPALKRLYSDERGQVGASLQSTEDKNFDELSAWFEQQGKELANPTPKPFGNPKPVALPGMVKVAKQATTKPERMPKIQESVKKAGLPVYAKPPKTFEEGVKRFPKADQLHKLYTKGGDLDAFYKELKPTLEKYVGAGNGDKFMAFVAATSPANQLRGNLKFAARAWKQHQAGEPITGFMKAHQMNLERAARGEDLSGPKVRQFYKDLLDKPEDAADEGATVDRWMLAIYGQDATKAPNKKMYNAIQADIAARAKEIGVPTKQYQAGLWAGARNKKETIQSIMEEEFGQKMLFEEMDPFAKMMDVEHRTPQGDLTELDPSKYGTGQAGAEKVRKGDPDWVDRSYLTVKGTPVEGRFRNLPVVEGKVPEALIYKMQDDPMGFIPEAQKLGKGDQMKTRSIFEKLIRDAGFKGGTDGNTVFYFDKLKVKPRQKP